MLHVGPLMASCSPAMNACRWECSRSFMFSTVLQGRGGWAADERLLRPNKVQHAGPTLRQEIDPSPFPSATAAASTITHNNSFEHVGGEHRLMGAVQTGSTDIDT